LRKDGGRSGKENGGTFPAGTSDKRLGGGGNIQLQLNGKKPKEYKKFIKMNDQTHNQKKIIKLVGTNTVSLRRKTTEGQGNRPILLGQRKKSSGLLLTEEIPTAKIWEAEG